jgi:hypothetical protein
MPDLHIDLHIYLHIDLHQRRRGAPPTGPTYLCMWRSAVAGRYAACGGPLPAAWFQDRYAANELT